MRSNLVPGNWAQVLVKVFLTGWSWPSFRGSNSGLGIAIVPIVKSIDIVSGDSAMMMADRQLMRHSSRCRAFSVSQLLPRLADIRKYNRWSYLNHLIAGASITWRLFICSGGEVSTLRNSRTARASSWVPLLLFDAACPLSYFISWFGWFCMLGYDCRGLIRGSLDQRRGLRFSSKLRQKQHLNQQDQGSPKAQTRILEEKLMRWLLTSIYLQSLSSIEV